MLKLATITCHNCYNFGASLQAYSLYKYLNDLGYECELIDYIPDYMEYNVRYRRISPAWNQDAFRRFIYHATKHPFIAFKFRRKKAFDNFKKNYIKTTRTYHSFKELEMNPPDADIYICGSDQIWNGEFYENGRDRSFYLDFAPEEKKRISYAASFGVEKLSNEQVVFIKPLLEKMSHISVREKSGIEILKAMQLNGTNVVDPVFLLKNNDWEKLIIKNKPIKKYILIYALDQPEKALEIAEKLRKDEITISIGEIKVKGSDKNIMNAGPLEFLYYISNASHIVTNSFHAVAFSIIFKKLFTVYQRSIHTNGRINNILDYLEIGDLAAQIKADKTFPYSDINEKMEALIIVSYQYLSDSLKL